MRVLAASNVFNVPSAYGQQLGYLIAFTEDIEWGVAALFGVEGGMMSVSGIPIFPRGAGRAGDGNVWQASKLFNPDMILSFYDPWALKFPLDPDKNKPWVSWTTVDSVPLSNRDRLVLDAADGIVAYSKFGRGVLEDEGYENVTYIPVGIPTQIFEMGDKVEAKRAMLEHAKVDIPADEMFLVGMVGRNNTRPSRKGFDTGLLAFKELVDHRHNAFLYLHTEMSAVEMGLDLHRMVADLGLQNRVLFCDQAQNRFGFKPDYMVQMYNSLDVLMQPSQAEGFGIPMIEAMACGTPVIGTQHSAITEILTGSGGRLVYGQPFYSGKDSWFAQASVKELVYALEMAYAETVDAPQRLAVRRATGRKFVVENYDFPSIVAPMWQSYLEGFMEEYGRRN